MTDLILSLYEGGVLTNLPEVHSFALTAAGAYLSKERVQQLAEGLLNLDKVENNEVISVLAEKGALPPSLTRVVQRLNNAGIYAGLMTAEEATKVSKYVFNETEAIKRQKAERVRDLVHANINGKKHRRDYCLDEDRHEKLEKLLEKYSLYERGEIDVSRSFEQTAYVGDVNTFRGEAFDSFADIQRSVEREYNLYIESGTYESFKGMGDEDNLSHIFQSLDDDELIENGYVDEGDVFCYAPYTYNDLDNLELFSWDTWTESTNFRHKARLSSLLEEYIPNRGNAIERDLNRDFIAREVLANRRLSARDLLTLMSVFALDAIEKNVITDSDAENTDSLIEFKRSLSFCSYYAGLICNMKQDELREKYKTCRPLNAEFFREVISCVEKWTDTKAKETDDNFAAYLIMLDDHLFNAEMLYGALLQGVNESPVVGLLEMLYTESGKHV